MTYNPLWDKLKPLQGSEPSPGGPAPAAPPRPTAPPVAGMQKIGPLPSGTGGSSGGYSGGGGYSNTPPNKLPAGYLKNGYFDELGNIKKELMVEHAREVARLIGLRQDRSEGIRNAQLRKFYGHVKTAESRMTYGVPFATIQPKILELSAFVAEAHGKGKVPLVFKEFMDANLLNVLDDKSFRDGFVKHFQAVVGFFSFYYKD